MEGGVVVTKWKPPCSCENSYRAGMDFLEPIGMVTTVSRTGDWQRKKIQLQEKGRGKGTATSYIEDQMKVEHTLFPFQNQ